MPREQAATVSPEALRRTSEGLESQTTSHRRPQLVRVPNDEILRLLQDMDRQGAEDRTRRREAQSQYAAHTAAASHSITKVHDLEKSKHFPLHRPRNQGTPQKGPGRCEKPFNSSGTLSSPLYITMTPVSASRSRRHQQDPGATKSRLPSK
ncbi:hypothetical protein HIM_10284 [Hirsutella minnesotensis 3608]|uniref:Uncharacterized protein n=1 Tax=Hirsutella minnesotensis 3608 TaxID=1043627 RepID=A0A0F7ZG58_9HYPO|nr:hypothetical protein HIM_10284 [Hirsutella minnesotensis 3608]